MLSALHATADLCNRTASDADKVELLFFNCDGFFDKQQADMAAGSNAFNVNLVATGLVMCRQLSGSITAGAVKD